MVTRSFPSLRSLNSATRDGANVEGNLHEPHLFEDSTELTIEDRKGYWNKERDGTPDKNDPQDKPNYRISQNGLAKRTSLRGFLYFLDQLFSVEAPIMILQLAKSK
jgi:hypothetical protein